MGSRARVRARARATARVGLVHAHMFSPNMAFITPTPMNMPSISRLEKTIVVMEQVFQLRSLHMAARTNLETGGDSETFNFVVPATAS